MDIDNYSLANGVLLGILLLLMLFSALIALAYNEPPLALTAVAAALGIVDLILNWPQFHLLMVPIAMCVLWLSVGKSGVVRSQHRLILGVSVIAAAFLALMGSLATNELSLAIVRGVLGLVWVCSALWLVYRAWPHTKPWISWVALGQALLFGGFSLNGKVQELLPLSQLSDWSAWQLEQIWMVLHVALFCMASYLGLVWRSRLLSEAHLRATEYATRDPLTGCMTIKQFRRVLAQAAHRSVNLRYKSGVMLVSCVNLLEFAKEIDPDSDESGILIASQLVRKILRRHDVIVRLQGGRFALLIEGLNQIDHMRELATKLIAAGLRHDLPSGEKYPLEFKIMAAPMIADAEQSSAWFAALEQQFMIALRAPQKRAIFELTDAQSEDLLLMNPS